MSQYTMEELKEIQIKSYRMGAFYDDSMEQYQRDYASVTLRKTIDTLLAMDRIIDGADGDHESAWNALHDSLMFDVGYYIRMCESLERGKTNG